MDTPSDMELVGFDYFLHRIRGVKAKFTIYRWIRQGIFPPQHPVSRKSGSNVALWRKAYIDAWFQGTWEPKNKHGEVA